MITFNPEIWGTVSDWVMIGVTVVTAVLLLETFRAQRKSNELVMINHKRMIQPKFSASNRVKSRILDNGERKYSISLKLMENDARNFYYSSLNGNLINET